MMNMNRRMLNDKQWLRIADLLPGKATDKGGRAADNRLFVEAVLYTARTGHSWRDLPAHFGNWHSVYVRFARWEVGGVWSRVAQALQHEADLEELLGLEELFIDPTVVRTHQHASGAPKKTVAIRRSAARAAA
jgi:transposase